MNPDPFCFLGMVTSLLVLRDTLHITCTKRSPQLKHHGYLLDESCFPDCRSDMHASDGSNCLAGGLALRLCCPFGLLLGIDLILVRADIASLKLCSSLQHGQPAMG